MSVNFGLVFILLPGVLHAQDCKAPTLDGGYFVPEQQIYLNGLQLTYSCDNGHKPVAESWWATSTCQNGTWSPQPQCIAQDCKAPTLDGGYFVPEQQIYLNGLQLTYSCDNGHKPVAESWWATSTCQNGTWSPQPQCIDEKSCIPPNIPNGEYSQSQTGWYEDGHTVRIKCNKGYEHKNRDATAKCSNGTWISVPVCEKSTDTCDAPPKIPHAVIINERHQEIFPANSELKYECEDGFHVVEADAKKSIYCLSGNWTTGPQCRSEDACDSPPKIPHAVIIHQGPQEILVADSELKYECEDGFDVEGEDATKSIYCLSGNWTTGPQCSK
ncbi:complement factor H-related protein 1-like [Thalassophryne amazonica]|uniref:complement factor H-related protein 1-like n=1 Tax=Thalassophryne amazonica TaxID=390379 RepID=UPI00147125DB|nr:complement factor H-related protein 1-like [Thalassophryne amazonica]